MIAEKEDPPSRRYVLFRQVTEVTAPRALDWISQPTSSAYQQTPSLSSITQTASRRFTGTSSKPAWNRQRTPYQRSLSSPSNSQDYQAQARGNETLQRFPRFFEIRSLLLLLPRRTPTLDPVCGTPLPGRSSPSIMGLVVRRISTPGQRTWSLVDVLPLWITSIQRNPERSSDRPTKSATGSWYLRTTYPVTHGAGLASARTLPSTQTF